MAALPPLAQIVGNHAATYEALFKQADTAGNGIISAMEAAAFMKKSGLQELVLSQIWELSDPTGKGYLDQQGFSVAMKLIAVAQTGQEATMASISQPHPPPNMGPPGSPAMVAPGSGTDDGWSIPQSERTKYDQIFDGLQPVNGLLSGSKVRPVLLNSKLPMDLLGRVWDLSDIDHDGFLDREEFSVAMHLVYKALEKEPVPTTLPKDMIPPTKRRKSVVGGVAVLPGVGLSGIGAEGRSSPALGIGAASMPGGAASAAPSSGAPWVVSPADKIKYDEMFIKADLDKDGYVNGVEIKDIFIQSGVPQSVLAHIWNLCDSESLGKLNTEQFALAMHLIQQKLKGIEPPTSLPPDMVPPSMRTGSEAGAGSVGETLDTSGMQELDMISKEIDQLKKEKMNLEQEKAQKEADIRIRNGEVAALQKELDAINATVMQLQTQKGEAQKRLDELDDKRTKLETDVKDNREKCEEEQTEINKLKSEIANQNALAQNQEAELKRLQGELGSLRQEEAGLERKVDQGKTQLDQLASTLTTASSQLDKTNSDVEKLKEANQTIQQAIEQYNKLISGDAEAKEPSMLSMELFSTKPVPSTTVPPATSRLSMGSGGGSVDDPFANKDPFANANGDLSHDPFADDPFKSSSMDDPFKGSDPFGAPSSDPFGGDPFGGDAFGSSSNQNNMDAFGGSSTIASNDPFGGGGSNRTAKSDDPWASAFSSGTSTSAKNDPFGAFGNPADLKSPVNPADPFGTGSFTSSTSSPSSSLKPTRSKSPAPPRPKSPAAPSLPPKQKKAPPPPRPAPPKSKSPVPGSGANTLDAFDGQDPFGSFGSSSGGGGGPAHTSNSNDLFADFADFNTPKFGSSPSPSPASTAKTATAPPMSNRGSEAEQLAWATRHSQEEFERQRRLQEQEQADLELAIALSKADLGQDSQA